MTTLHHHKYHEYHKNIGPSKTNARLEPGYSSKSKFKFRVGPCLHPLTVAV